MGDVDRFLDRHRICLLKYLDGKAPDSADESGPLEFIDEVLDEWEMFFGGRDLRAAHPRELTFWFALYQFEELVELPVTDSPDPYEAILMQNLETVRELLRERAELPEGFHATRPGDAAR